MPPADDALLAFLRHTMPCVGINFSRCADQDHHFLLIGRLDLGAHTDEEMPRAQWPIALNVSNVAHGHCHGLNVTGVCHEQQSWLSSKNRLSLGL